MSEDATQYTAEPLETTEIHPQSMLQLWFTLTEALKDDPDFIVCLAQFGDGLGIVLGHWSDIDQLPNLLRQTQVQHGTAAERGKQ